MQIADDDEHGGVFNPPRWRIKGRKKFQFIGDHWDEFPIHRMCKVLEVSSSGYYAWRRRIPSQREMAANKLVNKIEPIHQESRQTYGNPRVHAELVARGFCCSENRVARLMRANDIRAKCKKRPKKTTDSNQSHPVAPNRLKRDFSTQAPNVKWRVSLVYSITHRSIFRITRPGPKPGMTSFPTWRVFTNGVAEIHHWAISPLMILSDNTLLSLTDSPLF